MYLYCLTQENYPGLSKKTKEKLPLAKSKTTRSTARPPLLGWRCALVRILVFSFHLLSSSRRWLRWIDSGFLSEGFSVQARPVADPLLQCSFFSFSSEDLEKFEVFLFLRPAGSDPEVVCQKDSFLKVSVSLGGFGPSVAHGKHSVRRGCVQATKKQGRNLLSP